MEEHLSADAPGSIARCLLVTLFKGLNEARNQASLRKDLVGDHAQSFFN